MVGVIMSGRGSVGTRGTRDRVTPAGPLKNREDLRKYLFGND